MAQAIANSPGAAEPAGLTQRAQFAETMLRLMAEDEAIVVLLGDIGVHAFREHATRWPTRCLNVGVCEQGMVGMAAGMALEGLYPVVSTIDSFLVRRAYEFIRLDFGEQGLKGMFVTVGHDEDYVALGPSHCCIDGPFLMDWVAGMNVIEPTDADDVDLALTEAHRERDLAYIRLSEGKR